MLEQLIAWDHHIFTIINSQLTGGFLDFFLPFMRNQWVWFPFYFIMLLFFIIRYKMRGFAWSCWCIVTIAFADFCSSQLIKKTVERARPCHIPEELTDLIVKVHCGTGFSFTSSHATNHMALAAFIIVTTAICFKKWRWLFLPWALCIGYAQIYVGVHFPIDIISGFALGGLLGYVSAIFFQKSRLALQPAMKKA